MTDVLRMSEAEVERWYVGLFAHIAKQHPHLADREKLWPVWAETTKQYEKSLLPSE